MAPAWRARCSIRAARSASSRRRRAERCSKALKSRFMPYLKTTEQFSSLPLASLSPAQMAHSRKLFCGSGRRRSGCPPDRRRWRPPASRTRSPPPSLGLVGVQGRRAAPSRRRRDLVVEEGARDADARALQAVALQERRVVAVRRRRARARRRIVRIRRRAFQHAEHDRGVGHRPRHRAGGVLIGGNRNHAVAADAAHGRLDADQHVLVGRAQDRSRCFGADVAAQKLAAVPMPELDPPVFNAGRPSNVASRGSRRGSYGLNP